MPLDIEPPHRLGAVAAGHGRHMVDAGRRGHGRHGLADVAIHELGPGVAIEQGAERGIVLGPVASCRLLARPRAAGPPHAWQRCRPAGAPGRSGTPAREPPARARLKAPASPFNEDIMSADTLIPWLFGFTLIVALVAGIYQFLRVKRAQREHEPAVPGETQTGGIMQDPQNVPRHGQ